MAHEAVGLAPPNGGASLTAEELREILEYEKIVKFRDAILAGTHPRIKVPAHLVHVGRSITTARHVSSPNRSTPGAHVPPTTTSSRLYGASSPLHNRSPNNYRPGAREHVTMPAKPAKSEIDPILLQKSEVLIKAEIQQRRQKLERALREQIEQQRLSTKALLQTSESLPNFDPSEVLAKALAIVPPSTYAEVEPSAGARSPASDSFDENTFYSSQHDTPESRSSQGQKEPIEAQSSDMVLVPAGERPVHIFSNKSHVGDRDMVTTGVLLSKDDLVTVQAHSQTQHSQSQQPPTTEFNNHPLGVGNSESSNSLGTKVGDASSHFTVPQQGAATVSSHQDNPMDVTGITSPQPVDRMAVEKATGELLQQAFEDDTASPLIRAHNLSPVAPQPARVSPLATARDPPILRETLPVDEAPPAQVAALRSKPSGISSTDSSPKGVKGSEKKKGKKKKRKASSKENANTPDSPYIKQEPRSVSPFAGAPLPRPQKRQRQLGQYGAELNYDEPRYEPTEDHERPDAERYKDFRDARTLRRIEEDQYQPMQRRPEPSFQRLEPDDGEYHRMSGHYIRRPQSPGVYALPYAPGEGQPVRAVSHTIVDRRIHEEPRYYREAIPRASVRPDADRERSRSPVMRERRSPIPMGPPRQPMRIMVDAYGREYIDPTSATSTRQSAAPAVRYRDPEVIYERAPIRTISARAPVEAYEDDRVVYQIPSPQVAVPRRVITQPEYSVPEYRSYREREYTGRPAPIGIPGEEYVQIREAPERRHMSHFEEAPPREYLPRAPSARPEAVRYEIPREYVGRLESARPEMPPREYAARLHPDGRREMVPQSQREYSVRAVDSVHRQENVQAGDSRRYYEGAVRRPAEVAFIERPRAREASVVVYTDDSRRELYR